MSLILEALRKSEAERRRGQTPDLLSDATPATPTARVATRKAGSIVAVAVAALVTLVLVAWWLRSAAQPDPDSPTAGAVDSMPAPVPAAPPTTARAATAPPATAPAPVRAVPPLGAATASAAVPATTSPPAPHSPPAATPPLPAATTAAVANTALSAARMVPVPAPRPPPEPVAAIEPPPAPPAFASQDVPLRLADLSSDERQQLPTLKVSMHMWASEAANRFAIIDGTRVNEGDRVGQATVEAIEQDGVLLAWQGRRIRLPIR